MKPSFDFRYDVFVSYSHKDVIWVNGWLVPRLESFGVSVCVDYRDFEPGAPSLNEMERAVQTSRKILLVISSNFLESEWTEFEALMAQTLDPAARKRRVIPLLLEKTELPLRLSTLTYLNFSNPEAEEDQLERLVQAVKTEKVVDIHPRILLVENSESWIKLAKEVLADYTLDEVRTSSEGILKLKSGIRYDLVLSNLNLTEHDEASGEEVLEYIRDNCPSIPRIVITGKPARGPIYSTFFEGYHITEFFNKSDINVPKLRQLVRKILSPSLAGTKELQARKNELLSELRIKYDQSVRQLSGGLAALNVYEIRLRREVGQRQAEELTHPDRNVLMQKTVSCKEKFDNLTSQILIGEDLNVLDEIYSELRNEW